MNGRQPFEVYKFLNETRGQIPPIDRHLRRIQLGWEQDVTPSDEGVCVFRGIWFNSDDLQIKRKEYRVNGKVKVFVDPDNLNFATVVLPKAPDPIEVQLQITAFADMSLQEVLNLMAEQRRQDPRVTEFHHDQVMRTRLHRRAEIDRIGVENHLPRSYSTIEECQTMATDAFAGARTMRPAPLPNTTRPGEVSNDRQSGVVYRFGDHDAPSVNTVPHTLLLEPSNAMTGSHDATGEGGNDPAPSSNGPAKCFRNRPSPSRHASAPTKLSCTINLKDFL
jgi:hypothetical protein